MYGTSGRSLRSGTEPLALRGKMVQMGIKQFMHLVFRVQALGFRVQGLGLRVRGLGFRV